jgi:positive regulator of sigma E activity
MEVIAVRERGIVIEVHDGRALVEIVPAEGCGKSCSCSAVEGTPHLRRAELDAPDGVRPGAVVTLEVSSGQVLTSSAVVFLVPPVFFLGAALVSKPLLDALGARINPDLGMLIFGVAGFLIGLGGALVFSRRGTKRDWLKPRIVDFQNPTS